MTLIPHQFWKITVLQEIILSSNRTQVQNPVFILCRHFLLNQNVRANSFRSLPLFVSSVHFLFSFFGCNMASLNFVASWCCLWTFMHFLENVLELNRMEEIKLSWFLFFKITFFKIMCPLFPFPQCPICTFLCYKKKTSNVSILFGVPPRTQHFTKGYLHKPFLY